MKRIKVTHKRTVIVSGIVRKLVWIEYLGG